ncbi:hypothetical protein IWZ03DRAFT_367713 [Phyllosticta citriasiana]|uniref:Uncharacterized protein n=1 Tax=Phyllosticta citriasiana TaxID=595635 RepID=A0ABR1L0M8_9PEZI
MDSRTSAAQELLAMAQEERLNPTAHSLSESQDTLSTHGASQKTERDKFSSPVPPASSITPPPSSQVAPVVPAMRTSVRTPTPPTPVLSSPPPTSRTSTQLSGPALSFTVEQINGATAEELRDMVGELLIALREARTSAAHHKLQYNMLSIDSAEAQNRMAVELAMAQREVEVLQQSDERRRNTTTTTCASPSASQDPAVAQANFAVLTEMTRHLQVAQSENEELRGMLDQSKRVTEKREGEIASLLEQNERLRGRIRKNRDHLNGMLGDVYEGNSPVSATGTPRYPTTPRSRNRAHAVGDPGRERQAFEALLLADQMLSGKTTTAPTTPNKSKGRMGHTRGSQSLSSLPATPNRTSAPTGSQPTVAVPRTPPTFHAINHPPQTTSTAPVSAPRRRESTDSTITASSVEDNVVNESDKDTEIIESQASQMASSMLRRTPQHFTSSASPHASQSHGQPQRSTTGPMQTKLFGHVKKPGVGRPSLEKEKRSISGVEDHHDGPSPAKRGRMAESGIGLGIGGMSGSPRQR